MRTALVHYWLLNWRGGEKVLESLCRLLPDADIFTLFYDPRTVSDEIRRHKVTASFLNPLRSQYRQLLPLMPMALERFDLRGYDLVISSESGPAKGIRTSPSARHICYCHTPMRYLWHLYPDYMREWLPPWKRAALAAVGNRLRRWDRASAARVDEFVANSENVRRRIRSAWDRESRVVYSPVAVEKFYWREPEDYYVVINELVPYKRVDTAVRAFARMGRRLRIVGGGPEFKHLSSTAPPGNEYCGRISDMIMLEMKSRSFAIIMPG